ncbi:hypothetical protein D5R40_06120 [Okeania hirsuta]|uniref:Uncharacterized protein n=1 Tax=Okeania hirsuta TaxID=1458930 RepID=A0A3N6QR68_9CYAN|nr:hypothetical protein D4Z78_16555 [Okeania hirsuta]RQH50938.1 hypothetical protein D5R40_06120 [Okeania hirsuta]
MKRADRTVIVGNNNTGQLKLSSLSDSLVFIPRLKHGGLQRRFSVKTAQEILADSQTIPAGISPNPELQGLNYRIKELTLEKQRQAEKAYLMMKKKEENRFS